LEVVVLSHIAVISSQSLSRRSRAFKSAAK